MVDATDVALPTGRSLRSNSAGLVVQSPRLVLQVATAVLRCLEAPDKAAVLPAGAPWPPLMLSVDSVSISLAIRDLA